MSERKFPIQGLEKYTNQPVRIPWEVAEMAYEEYKARYGTQQTLERLSERGGFGVWEVIDLLAARIKRLTK